MSSDGIKRQLSHSQVFRENFGWFSVFQKLSDQRLAGHDFVVTG
jgi:hypothetical protein